MIELTHIYTGLAVPVGPLPEGVQSSEGSFQQIQGSFGIATMGEVKISEEGVEIKPPVLILDNGQGQYWVPVEPANLVEIHDGDAE